MVCDIGKAPSLPAATSKGLMGIISLQPGKLQSRISAEATLQLSVLQRAHSGLQGPRKLKVRRLP